jgi:hypothetical protein
MGKGLDSSCIAPSLERTLLVRLVIIGTIVVIVPFFTSLHFKAVALVMLVFNPVTCIFAVNDVPQVSVILVSPSATFLWCSETIRRVPLAFGHVPLV